MKVISSTLPKKIVGGDVLQWTDIYSVAISSTALLQYYFTQANSTNKLFVDGVAVTSIQYDFEATLPDTPATYLYQQKLVGSNGAITLRQGLIEVTPNYATTTNLDYRSDAQKLLDIVEEAIKARIEGGAVKEYEIAGRRLDRYPLTDLLALRSQLQKEVAQEKRAIALSKGLDRRIYVRFAQPHW